MLKQLLCRKNFLYDFYDYKDTNSNILTYNNTCKQKYNVTFMVQI